MTLLKKSWLLACAFIMVALFSCNPKDNSGESSSTRNPNWPELSENGGLKGDTEWIGVGWHTMYMFTGTEVSRAFKIPTTRSEYSAIFDFCISVDGKVWIPILKYDFTDAKILCLDLSEPEKVLNELRFDDTAPNSQLIPVPFNVVCDEEWLYVLRKYSLSQSMLTRVKLDDTSVRESIVLPKDGGGLSGTMALSHGLESETLAIILHESLAIVDRQSFALIGVKSDKRLYGQVKYSANLDAYVIGITGQSFEIANPSDAGEYEKYVVQPRIPGGRYYYSIPQIGLAYIGNEIAIDFMDIDISVELLNQGIGAGSRFDLSDDGSMLLGISEPNAVVIINIDAPSNVEAYVCESRLSGVVLNIGDNVFSLGGNILFDLKTKQFIKPKGDVISNCEHMATIIDIDD